MPCTILEEQNNWHWWRNKRFEKKWVDSEIENWKLRLEPVEEKSGRSSNYALRILRSSKFEESRQLST